MSSDEAPRPSRGVAMAIWVAELAGSETAYRLRLARESYDAGHAAGRDAGYQQAVADMAERWAEIARPVTAAASSPSHADLETRRWGPGGREHFADPRPGDFPGRGTPDPEPEAG